MSLMLLACGWASAAFAQAPCTQPVATVQSIRNSVDLVQAGTAQRRAASARTPLCAGDRIEVRDRSRAVVFLLASNTSLVLDQNSELVINAPGATAATTTFMDLVRGALYFITRVRRSFEVRTPFANASVEGTEFVVRVQDDRTLITVLEGAVRAANPAGTLLVQAGQQAVAVSGQAPQLQVIVRPRDAVQWALYYDPVLPDDSFAQLDAIPDADRDAMFFVRRAALLLSAGQLQDAQADLAQAQQLNPNLGEARAVLATVAVANNDRPAALEHARAAIALSPESVSAHLALSHALQASFQLREAREAAERAANLAPQNAAIWTRVAELRLQLDDLAGAADAAERAVSLAPTLARAHTGQGFVALANLDLASSRRAFEEATELDPNDPYGRLGLGLTRLMGGDLAGGRTELQTAAALDPESALVRSYLGKAYAEEGRLEAAATELALARQLDPLDPTPWFYDAIVLQDRNRPVDAFVNLERSIALNGNRAVYRSRLGLESDAAMRGARLGRVYRDLGFEHLALLEGWKSLAVAPADYSAHRLLADAYLLLPRHEIARDSELLQAQLLQPLNINPVQPLLADDAAWLLDDRGISAPGYNEFTSYFAGRNRLRFAVDGLAGQRDTRADNIILSGVHGRLSWSAGHASYQTGGIRPNHDWNRRAFNGFLQVAATPATSLLFEARHTDAGLGDQRMLFDPDNFFPDFRSASDAVSLRVGGRHVIAPGATIIGTYTHRHLDSDFNAGEGFLVDTDEVVDLAEARYLLQRPQVSLTMGIGHFWGDRLETVTVESEPLPPAPFASRHTNGYVYADVNALRPVTVTLGLGIHHFDDGLFERTPVDPKVGITWVVDRSTTVRAAAFRAFQRTLLSSQTIEPTSIAGFNQLFDEATAAQSWQYAAGVDRRLGERLHASAELTFRAVDIPFIQFEGNVPSEVETDERVARFYGYATPYSWLALAATYSFERFVGDPLGNNPRAAARSITHRVGGEARLFSAWGSFARVKGTTVDLDGEFQDPTGVVVGGNDRFVTVDLSIGHRLPRHRAVIALEVRNLLDRAFNFQDTSPEAPTLLPRRTVSVRLTLAL